MARASNAELRRSKLQTGRSRIWIAPNAKQFGRFEADVQGRTWITATLAAHDGKFWRESSAERRSPEGIAAAPQADRLREAVAQAELEHDRLRASRSYTDLGPAVQRPKDAVAADKAETDANSMRSAGDTTQTRRAIPPLEDRFNVFRIGLVEREYHFRDQAGKVAFTDKLLSITTASESPAAMKAMVDRAAERGWETVRLDGSPEFVRQGWIAAAAQGLKAVGHSPTAGDREAAVKEWGRLQVGLDGVAPARPGEALLRVQSAHVERVSGDRGTAEIGGQRQLAAAIEKALVDGKVSPELRGRVRAMMAAEGAQRVARGERVKVPVFDARAPRAQGKVVQVAPQRRGDRERSR